MSDSYLKAKTKQHQSQMILMAIIIAIALIAMLFGWIPDQNPSGRGVDKSKIIVPQDLDGTKRDLDLPIGKK